MKTAKEKPDFSVLYLTTADFHGNRMTGTDWTTERKKPIQIKETLVVLEHLNFICIFTKQK